MKPPPAPGPLDEAPAPSTLRAHVVTPGAAPRVHGYDVEGDLARHYGAAETTLLALTGELPAPEVARAFEVATAFLAPVSVAEAPAHAAVLARLCRARTSGILGIAAIALAEQARTVVADHADLVAWLDRPSGDAPARGAATDDDARSVARLRAALAPTGLRVGLLDRDPTRTAALVAVLHACGLVRPEQIETAIVIARLPCVMAEASAVRPGRFRRYPTNLPPFRYED
jgi:hypothetical protein